MERTFDRGNLIFLFILLFGIPAALHSQSIDIKPSSIKKKDHFIAVVKLLESPKVKGKLVSVTDSSIIICTSCKGVVTDTGSAMKEVSYRDIDIVILKHRSPWISLAGAISGLALGSALGLALGLPLTLATAPWAYIGFGIGMATGLTLGVLLPLTGTRKYYFWINGNKDKYLNFKADLKLMSLNG